MQRRRFLGLFGSAVAAPMVPVPAMAQPAYSQAAWNTAVSTARSSAALSVNGMSHVLKISPAATEALMRDMVRKGLLNPIIGPYHGGLWASSKVMKAGNIAAIHKAQQAARAELAEKENAKSQTGDWISHLQKICIDNGYQLSARAVAVTA